MDPVRYDVSRAYRIESCTWDESIPTNGTIKDWIRFLEEKQLSDGDIIVCDRFNTAAYEDHGVPLDEYRLKDPHMEMPSVASMEHSKVMAGSVENIKFFISAIRKRVVVIVLAPGPKYITSRCCREHMIHWSEEKDPQEIMDLLVPLDIQIKDILSNSINGRYLSLRDLADMMFGKNIALMQAWQGMVNDSQLFFIASIGRRLMDLFIDLGNDQGHLREIDEGIVNNISLFSELDRNIRGNN